MKNKLCGAVFAALIIGQGSALAVDGTVLIDQNRAMAGGITPGDAPGFPVTISVPGSYKLSGNLTVTGGSGIVITANGVTLDLNGFTIDGGGTCTGTPVTSCSGGSGARGVDAESVNNAHIRNGVVRGFQNQGVSVAPFTTGYSIVEDIRATENGNDGIKMQGGTGIIRGSTSNRNGASGISASDGALVIANVVSGNKGAGLFFFGAGGYKNNVSTGNGTSVSGSSALNLGSNVCGAAICP